MSSYLTKLKSHFFNANTGIFHSKNAVLAWWSGTGFEQTPDETRDKSLLMGLGIRQENGKRNIGTHGKKEFKG